jgi:hypothetical protein
MLVLAMYGLRVRMGAHMKNMKKQDRWERLVVKEQCGNALDGYFLRPDHVTRLLHREHRAVMRVVQDRAISKPESAFGEGYNMAINDILAKLKARGA